MVLQENVPLAPLTTFRIGGNARYYAHVSGEDELREAVSYAEQNTLPLFILGGGSNVLFADAGFAGVVVHLADGGIEVQDRVLFATAGVPLAHIVQRATDESLQGIEKLSGIPGSFGGAVRGNAGAFGTEIGSVVTSVKAFDRHARLVREYTREECHFSYRTSLFKYNPNLVVLSAVIGLVPGDRDVLEHVMQETVAVRESTHPQDARCAGSFFMNPVVDNKELLAEFAKDSGKPSKDGKLPAGWLIDHVGLRGKRVGGARVSPYHPNYLLNTGEATALDVVTLASLIKTRVRDELRIRLQEEVQLVGF